MSDLDKARDDLCRAAEAYENVVSSAMRGGMLRVNIDRAIIALRMSAFSYARAKKETA